MEKLTEIKNGVTVYIGPKCDFEVGMLPIELRPEHIRCVLSRLAAYENTGLEPEEIMGLCSMHERAKMAELLRMEESRPLTLEELREMAGEPVYLSPGDCYVLVSHNGFVPIFSWPDGSSCSACDWYTQVGPAYRRKPEEVET